jgi:hypothetical protein
LREAQRHPEFYEHLGARRLSSLVKEEYRTGQELRGSKTALDVRALVLQRLPLFLHDHTHEGQRIQYAWLNDDAHFVVRAFGRVAVAKTLKYGGIHENRSLDVSAVAKQDGGYSYGKGCVQLWLSGHTQVDMFEYVTRPCSRGVVLTNIQGRKLALSPALCNAAKERCAAVLGDSLDGPFVSAPAWI